MQKTPTLSDKFLGLLNGKWFRSGNRLDIKVTAPVSYRILDVLNLLVIIILWLYTFYIFPQLPEEIPVHFTWDGSADDWRSKFFIFLEISILLVIFCCLSLLSKYHIYYSYPVKITLENAVYQYCLALKFFTILKTLNVILFTYIHYVMVVGSFDKEKAYFGCTFWIIVLLICSSTFIYKKIALKSDSIINSRPKTD